MGWAPNVERLDHAFYVASASARAGTPAQPPRSSTDGMSRLGAFTRPANSAGVRAGLAIKDSVRRKAIAEIPPG